MFNYDSTYEAKSFVYATKKTSEKTYEDKS